MQTASLQIGQTLAPLAILNDGGYEDDDDDGDDDGDGEDDDDDGDDRHHARVDVPCVPVTNQFTAEH